jgi:hypothetical protein
MAEPEDDVIASRHDRVGTLRKRGRISGAALAVVPASDLDVRAGPPPAPERLSDEERELWEELAFARRPYGSRGLKIEAALRKAKPGVADRYQKLARTHRHAGALAATLATRLLLTPHSKLDKRTPTDGELPVA